MRKEGDRLISSWRRNTRSIGYWRCSPRLARVLAIDPKLTIAGFRAYARFAAPEVPELYVAGLRLAGLPEG